MGMTTFRLLYFVFLVAASAIRTPCAWRAGWHRAERSQPWLDIALMILAGVGMLPLPLALALSSRLDFADCPLPAWAGWAGVALFATGLWLLWRSHAALGKQWSKRVELRADHELITQGVYRHIRHPMYTAHLLWGVAQMLLLQNWIAGPAMLVPMVLLCVERIPHEERMMIERFGQAYRDYMSRTGRLLPRWR